MSVMVMIALIVIVTGRVLRTRKQNEMRQILKVCKEHACVYAVNTGSHLIQE